MQLGAGARRLGAASAHTQRGCPPHLTNKWRSRRAARPSISALLNRTEASQDRTCRRDSALSAASGSSAMPGLLSAPGEGCSRAGGSEATALACATPAVCTALPQPSCALHAPPCTLWAPSPRHSTLGSPPHPQTPNPPHALHAPPRTLWALPSPRYSTLRAPPPHPPHHHHHHTTTTPLGCSRAASYIAGRRCGRWRAQTCRPLHRCDQQPTCANALLC